MSLPEETLYILIYFPLLCCCCFSILKCYVYPRNFISMRKEQLCLGELYQRVPDLRLSGILTRSQICYIPSTLWNSDRNSILEIFCLHFWCTCYLKGVSQTNTSKCFTQLHIVSLFAIGLPFYLVSSFTVCSNFYWHI